jgi:serine/threonine protein kinase
MESDAQALDVHSRSPSASYHAADEPIPGYLLIEPIGSGGFGEVWKCQAPGGFLKAIKFVRGKTADGETRGWLAQQELRAMELIKNIRHPFILTVERAELLQGTLIVVMELADRNMSDLLFECEGRGLAGIPRAELLDYLGEAAEALDLMNFQHGLQHLDVKPQNLFLVGSHAKVADFGLVNRLPEKKRDDSAAASQGQVPLGITPRYAAPEILQQRISRRSDQYSLAIVYQESLTGQLPFKGRTGRQLYLQHLQALPDLAPLPQAERGIVARALSKDPDERFASCRDFVQALKRCRPDTASAAAAAATVAVPAPAADAAPGAATPDDATPDDGDQAEDVERTDLLLRPQSKVQLANFTYEKLVAHTPLGEIWQMLSADGQTHWGYHLQGFALEGAAEQEKALTYLQNLRHAALPRFKIGQLAPHRIILIMEPWGPSLLERCRAGNFSEQDLLRALAQTAHALDDLAGLTNLEHLGLSPDAIVQGIDGEQLLDFGLISLLWKSGAKALDSLNPRYSAPELTQGRSNPMSDQYSLALLYADLRALQLGGRLGPAHKSRSAAIDLAAVPAPERPALLKALDADPHKRFKTCVEFIEALAAAKGGEASQTTTAVQAAMAATQGSFVSALHEWIGRQPSQVRGPGALALGADGTIRHICTIDIVPVTAKLRLEVFQQEWAAQSVPSPEKQFRFVIPLVRSFWQRLRGKPVGVAVQIDLQPVGPSPRPRLQAAIAIRPVNCKPALTRHIVDALAPAMLQSLEKCLNALADRRREARLPLRAEVAIRHRASGGRPTQHLAQVINISREGIGLVSGSPLQVGSEIRLILSLPQEPDQPLVLVLKAIVKRCDPRPDGRCELGAVFVSEPLAQN